MALRLDGIEKDTVSKSTGRSVDVKLRLISPTIEFALLYHEE